MLQKKTMKYLAEPVLRALYLGPRRKIILNSQAVLHSHPGRHQRCGKMIHRPGCLHAEGEVKALQMHILVVVALKQPLLQLIPHRRGAPGRAVVAPDRAVVASELVLWGGPLRTLPVNLRHYILACLIWRRRVRPRSNVRRPIVRVHFSNAAVVVDQAVSANRAYRVAPELPRALQPPSITDTICPQFLHTPLAGT